MSGRSRLNFTVEYHLLGLGSFFGLWVIWIWSGWTGFVSFSFGLTQVSGCTSFGMYNFRSARVSCRLRSFFGQLTFQNYWVESGFYLSDNTIYRIHL